jgi:hypothetical protein
MSIELGKFNTLEVVKTVDFGVIWTERKKEKYYSPLVMFQKIVCRAIS